VQQQIIAEAGRFNVINCGRRFGKDVMAIDRLIESALHGYPTAWFAPTYKQLVEVWRTLSDTLAPVTARRSEQTHRLELLTKGVIDMWSLDSPDVARGRAYKRVVINEAAMIAGLQNAWEQVIRPTLADYQGDAWFPSTPKGFNYFKALYDRGQDSEQPDWKSWTYPTSSNPFIAQSEIDAAQRELPESTFAQEYLAAFVSDETSVFRRLLEAATLQPQAPIEGHQYVVGCDWGKVSDFSVFSVIDATTRSQVFLDRSNRIDYVVQVQRLKALCDRYKPALVVCETNAMGQAIVEWVQRAKLPLWGWNTNQASKQRMIEDLALAFEQNHLHILKDPVQLAELQAYEAVRTPSGMLRYSAPEGQHDDTVIGLALAWQAAKEPLRNRPQQIDFRFAQ
jgi:hypothetical protein